MIHYFIFHFCPASQVDLDAFTDMALKRAIEVKHNNTETLSKVTEKEIDTFLSDMGRTLAFQKLGNDWSLVTFSLDF